MARPLARHGWRTAQPDAAKVGPMLREAGFVGSDRDPTSVRASIDADGRLRHVHARYADGWSCTMRVAHDGSYSLSQCLRMRVAGRASADRVTDQRKGEEQWLR